MKFDISAFNGLEVDKSNVYTDYLNSTTTDPSTDILDQGVGTTAVFEVRQPGYYCVYTDHTFLDFKQRSSITLKVMLVGNYGYLKHHEYMEFIKHKYSLLVAALTLVLLLYKIVRYVPSDSSEGKPVLQFSNSSSILAQSIVLYVLSPYIVVVFIQCASMSLANAFGADETSWYKLTNFSTVLTSIYCAGMSSFTILFSMGYGIISNYDVGSRNYRVVTSKQRSLAFKVFIASWLCELRYYFFPLDARTGFTPLVEMHRTISGVFHLASLFIAAFLSLIIYLSVLSLVIYHYFNTKKLIGKLSLTNEGGSQVSKYSVAKINSLIRKSWFLILFAPTLFSLSLTLLSFSKGNSSSIDENLLVLNKIREVLLESVKRAVKHENTFATKAFFEWISENIHLFTMVWIFFVWLDYDNGFMVENGSGDILLA